MGVMKKESDMKKMSAQAPKRRSAVKIMTSLIGLVNPLLHIMLAAILLGTAGYLCAIFLTILAGQVVLRGVISAAEVFAGTTVNISVVTAEGLWDSVRISGPVTTLLASMPVRTILGVMILIAILRGILHYAEQYCNHFIAFKLLAIIRHKVFAALRKLCPAKLEGKDKGNLISIITTDIELLEVFYAHTISPIAIAVLTSLLMVVFIGSYHVLAGAFAMAAYLMVGVVIPLWNGRCGSGKGMEFRADFGELNSFVLDSLRGLDETIQYGQGENRKAQMSERSEKLSELQAKLSKMEGAQRSCTNLVILLASFGMLGLTMQLYDHGGIGFDGVLTCTIAMMGSFGPVVALSSLSNNLNQTLASGERVLSLLEEKPLVEEIANEEHVADTNASNARIDTGVMGTAVSDRNTSEHFTGAAADHVIFKYCEAADEKPILNNYSIRLEPGRITGIHGASGSGKSTLLKLLMRFWDVDAGRVSVNGADVRTIPTRQLRNMESYVTQETHLFHDSIANNIGIAKPGATREEIMEAAKKASVHDFIMTLPDGYDTKVGELGDTLSGGEKQRIGIARAFLHDAPLILLDEPTSNLDSLNEGIILKSLREEAREKTVVLVSHRESTMRAADVVVELDSTRIS